ncbi:MAG TPA: hypothetical protein VFA47_03145 [Candidatus Manganitrophaceae bacterium]|nr:hypothetical protein [Candidatus Manganitrophaceae bacterium]
MSEEEEAYLDELLGRTRCVRCGQILDGEIECPFCSYFPEPVRAKPMPKWVYLTACFLTSPLSLPFLYATPHLSRTEKWIAGSGALFWPLIFVLM